MFWIFATILSALLGMLIATFGTKHKKYESGDYPATFTTIVADGKEKTYVGDR
jgi:hypothetical protein